MLTVRYPNGMAVTYNNANHCAIENGYVNLLTKKGGYWVARIPDSSGAIVEFRRPCAVTAFNGNATQMLKYIRDNMRDLTSYADACVLSDIKMALRDFNARTGMWK